MLFGVDRGGFGFGFGGLAGGGFGLGSFGCFGSLCCGGFGLRGFCLWLLISISVALVEGFYVYVECM